MKKGYFLVILIIFFLMGLTSAQPPFQTFGGSTGYTINYPKFEYLQINQNFTFHFHVYNTTDGVLITNDTASCAFHVYNNAGNHIIQIYTEDMDSNLVDWDFFINGENFTEIGDYSYLIQCNSSIQGGFDSNPFYVSNNKLTSTTADSIFYSLVTFIVFIIFIIVLYLNLKIPYKSQRNERGEITFIPKSKYIKLLMIPLTVQLFVWLFNLLLGISINFISLNMYNALAGTLFIILINLWYPVVIIVFLLIGINLIRDLPLMRLIKKFGSAKNF